MRRGAGLLPEKAREMRRVGERQVIGDLVDRLGGEHELALGFGQHALADQMARRHTGRALDVIACARPGEVAALIRASRGFCDPYRIIPQEAGAASAPRLLIVIIGCLARLCRGGRRAGIKPCAFVRFVLAVTEDRRILDGNLSRNRAMPKKIMFDSDVHDAIAADAELKQLIVDCQRDGRIELMSTHVQADQLAQIPLDRDIGQATAVQAEQIPTSAGVWDVSRWGSAHWGTEAANIAVAKLSKNKSAHVEDGLIGATALSEADVLVTNDKRFRRRAKAAFGSFKVLSSDELKDYLKSL
jgi:hypothetical protein